MSRRTLLVHPQGLLRCALRELLTIHRLTESVETAANSDDAVDCIDRVRPDLIIYCATSAANDTPDALRRLRQRQPCVPILIIGERDHPLLVRQWLDAGANCYLLTTNEVDDLKRAFAALIQGENFLPDPLARALVFRARSSATTDHLNTLSRRELQVLVKVVDGHSINEIAAGLHISPKTVGTYRHRLFRKLNVRNDAELAQLAVTAGITMTGRVGTSPRDGVVAPIRPRRQAFPKSA